MAALADPGSAAPVALSLGVENLGGRTCLAGPLGDPWLAMAAPKRVVGRAAKDCEPARCDEGGSKGDEAARRIARASC